MIAEASGAPLAGSATGLTAGFRQLSSVIACGGELRLPDNRLVYERFRPPRCRSCARRTSQLKLHEPGAGVVFGKNSLENAG
jgi:hypothetical protein